MKHMSNNICENFCARKQATRYYRTAWCLVTGMGLASEGIYCNSLYCTVRTHFDICGCKSS